jgi:hypothetical protein
LYVHKVSYHASGLLAQAGVREHVVQQQLNQRRDDDENESSPDVLARA